MMPRFSAITSARADRVATSNQAGVPLGEERGVSNGKSESFGYDLRSAGGSEELASAAGRCTGSASHILGIFESNFTPVRILRRWIGSFPYLHRYWGARVTPPGTMTTGLSRSPASAIIIAGNPLSQEAIPMTPLAVGRERAWRRKTCAASLRYGRESIIPVVPCVRPSHGSEQNVANGSLFKRSNSCAAAFDHRRQLKVTGVESESYWRAVFFSQSSSGWLGL